MGVPTKVISSSIPFQDGAGNVVANGTLRLQLTQNATVTSGGGQVTTEPIFFLLDANGKIPANSVCWFNDELTPSGTAYHATLVAKNGCRTIVDYGNWVLAGASADVSTIAASATTVSYSNAVLTNPPGSALQTINGPLTVTGKVLSTNIESIRYADQFSSITAAIADLGGNGGVVYIPAGTYLDNIVITTSHVTLKGAGIGVTIIKPSDTTKPVISIDGTSVTSIDSVELEDFSIYPIAATSCDAGLQIKGKTASNQINDHHKFRHIEIGGTPTVAINTTGTNNFRVGIEIIGRTIWSTFENVDVRGTRGDGLKVSLTGGVVGPVNACAFHDCEFVNNYGYGVNWNTAGAVTGSQAIEFSNCNIQFNANNAALSPSAGAVFQGVWSANMYDCSFEENCTGAADANRAHLRLTGTACRNFNIFGGTFLNDTGTSAKYGIFSDASNAPGTWTGLDFIGSGYTKTVHVAIAYTGELRNPVIVGSGFGMGAPDFVADSFGNSAAMSLYPFAPAIYQVGNAAFPITANVIDLTDSGTAQPGNVLGLVSGPNTVNNITGATVGQMLWLFTVSGSANTIANAAGGTGQITLRDGANRTLAAGDWLMLYSQDGANWKEVGLGNYLQDGNVTQLKRVKTNQGSALVTGDVGSISGGWGTTATCSAVTGRDQAGTISMASSGTGQGANPTFVLTFHDGTWTTAPIITATRTENGAPSGGIVASTTATAAIFTFLGTPVAGTTYTISFICMGV